MESPSSQGSSRRSIIRRIEVRRLFGRYDYDIRSPGPNVGVGEGLLILYGENGSGKTTILNLTRHLLAAETGARHRSAVAQTRFESFTLELADGLVVSASRGDHSDIGDFEWKAEPASGTALVASIKFLPDGRLNMGSPRNQQQYREICSLLATRGLLIHHLSARRRAELPEDEERAAAQGRHLGPMSNALTRFIVRSHGPAPSLEASLEAAVARAMEWVNQKARKASATGSEQAHTIYTRIVTGIVAQSDQPRTTTSSGPLLERLASIAATTQLVSKAGLMPALDVSELSRAVAAATATNLDLVSRVVTPYLDGLTARLEALTPIQTAVQTFVDRINSLYLDKSVSLSLAEGLTVASAGGEPLALDRLSSGEQQLLLLFSGVLAARDEASIFIIDEPELSLNVKWQRQLVGSLLDLIGSGDAQFILATHSIELLAQYGDNVVRLDPTTATGDA
jgi:energy-coupling factor transporter ATP-binding protein EcfA2